MAIIPPTVIGSTIAPTVIGTTISPTVIGSTIAPTTIGSSVAPTVISSTIAPTTIGTTIAPMVISNTIAPSTESSGGPSRQELTPAQVQAQAEWSLIQHLDAETDRLEAQALNRRPGAVEFLNPAHESFEGGGSGGGGGSPPVSGRSANAPNPGARPRGLDGGRGPAGWSGPPTQRNRQISQIGGRARGNSLGPRSVVPRVAESRTPIPSSGQGGARPGRAVQESIKRHQAAAKIAADRLAANRAALSAPPGVRMPSSLRPPAAPSIPGWNPAAIARGALPWLSRGLRIFGRVPFLSDLLFPEPTGNLDQSPYAGVRPGRAGNPLFNPSGQSPGGTPAPPQPDPPPKPGVPKPPGSADYIYQINSSGYRSVESKFNPAWYGSRPEDNVPPFLHTGWSNYVTNSVQVRGPLILEYSPADPIVSSYYPIAPSSYSAVFIRSGSTGEKILLLSGLGYFANLTSLQIVGPPGLPEPWEVPPKDPPPIPRPPIAPQAPTRDPIWPTGPDPSRPNLPEVSPPNQPAPVPGSPGEPGGLPGRDPGKAPQPVPGRRPNLDPKTPTPPRPKAPPVRPPARAPRINPPRSPIPGIGKGPGLARPPCLPKPLLEDNRVTCKYNPASDAMMIELMKRVGDPGTITNGLSGALSTNENSVQKTLGDPIKNRGNKSVSVTNYLKGMRGIQVLTQAMNFLNIFLLLHNAAMLSRNLVESVGDLMSMGLQAVKTVFTGGQATDDDPIDINELVGQGFQGLMNDIFGKEQWKQIQAKWISFNRIITSAANVAYTIQGIFDGARNIIEITSTNVARIGNALKNSRVVNQNGYGFMNPNLNSATGRTAKLFDMLNNSAEVADLGTSVAGEVINISEEGKELADATKRFNDNVQEGTNRYNEKGELIDKDGKLIRPGDAQGTALAESARRVSQGSEISLLDLLKGEQNPQ